MSESFESIWKDWHFLTNIDESFPKLNTILVATLNSILKFNEAAASISEIGLNTFQIKTNTGFTQLERNLFFIEKEE